MANKNVKKAPAKKGVGLHITTGVVTALFTILGLVLFCLSFTTNYYTFGQMNSGIIVGLIAGALVCLLGYVITHHRAPEAVWPHVLSFAVIGLLAASAMLIIADRVEGIGNCIITDYDSGHGGEEAIYMSLVGATSLLVGMVYHIIGTFSANGAAPAGKGRTFAIAGTGSVLWVAAIVATVMLTGAFTLTTAPGTVTAGSGTASQGGTYTVSFNRDNNNLDGMPDYQFLTANMSGLMKFESRLYVDLTLKLDGAGKYSLLSDCYVIEAGKRAAIGDESGIGLVYQTTAEGSYTDNGDGTVTIAVPEHAAVKVETDTYSDQMKDQMKIDFGGSREDGVYDSADWPQVFNYVPETTFVLEGDKIASYDKPALKGTFAVALNKDNDNMTMGGTQFLTVNMKSLMNADNRFFVELTLELDGTGNYTLTSDSYVLEAGKRAVIGDESGIGLIYTVKAEGTYVDNGNGTVTTSPATHVVLTLDTDTYSDQMKQMMKLGDFDIAENGVHVSADKPALLNIVPEVTWTLESGAIKDYAIVEAEPEVTAAPEPTVEPAQPAEAQSVTIVSDDEGTKMTFSSDGTYTFAFEAYGISESGTYTYANGVLTVINPNGAEATAEGDPLKLHYVSAKSEQLVGDYTIPAVTFAFGAEEAAAPAEVQSVTILSDDEGTKMTFCSDGTYTFAFETYGISESGTYTYANGVLIVINPNGAEATAEGDPLRLHYVSAKSEQLVGDYTIPAATFAFGTEETATPAEVQSVTILSDDEGTKMTFCSDGTYTFAFETYGIEESGTYTYANGVLIVTNPNGAEATAEGDPLKLHYVSAKSEQLVGDYTIPAATFAFCAEEVDAPAEVQSVTILSDDEGTKMTFCSDGTYTFAFETYGISESGTYTYANGVLIVTNPNGAEATAEGDPLKLHYVSAKSEQLVGDYTIPASTFGF